MGYTGEACDTCATGFFHPTAAASVCIRLAKVSCFDGVKNGNEAGIDCGGDCERECVVLPTEDVGIEPMW